LRISTFGRFQLVGRRETKNPAAKRKPLELIDSSKTLPLEIRFADSRVNDEAFRVSYTASSAELNAEEKSARVLLTQKLKNTTVRKELTFYPDGHYDLNVECSRDLEYFLTPGHRPEADKSKYMIVRGVLVRDKQGVITTVEDEDAKETEVLEDSTILSSFDRYYASLFFNFTVPFKTVITPEANGNPLAFAAIKKSSKFSAP
jgi:YidC/Oxa1 family membrane protein insertase